MIHVRREVIRLAAILTQIRPILGLKSGRIATEKSGETISARALHHACSAATNALTKAGQLLCVLPLLGGSLPALLVGEHACRVQPELGIACPAVASDGNSAWLVAGQEAEAK